MRKWKRLTQEEIKSKVLDSLSRNINYTSTAALGIPASYLDPKVFNQDASFLNDAPFITTMVRNPNHIGCHTLPSSESYFAGTQEIERELIAICAEDILKGELSQQDGYVASGGTEANMQAIWIYRNFFIKERNADLSDICIICSEDSHYSMDKSSNVLCIDIRKVPVCETSRIPQKETICKVISQAKHDGKKFFIVICNMMTTMFGSVDNPDYYSDSFKEIGAEFKMHIDGAYGGFYYPFANEANTMNFSNPFITSITLDAHKMAQAPYGTGIFLIRKGYMQYANTQEASYVKGEDSTLIGSRSGANAVAVWMILCKNGPNEWHEKVYILQKRTQWICDKLKELSIRYYRHQHSNIVTINAADMDSHIAEKYGLVPDNHQNPLWFKIVVMEHVIIEKLEALVNDLTKSKQNADT